MAQYNEYTGAGADFADSGFFGEEGGDAGDAGARALLEFTVGADGYAGLGGLGGLQGGGFFDEAFPEGMGDALVCPDSPLASHLASHLASPLASQPASPAPSEAVSIASTVSLSNSLDDVGVTALSSALTPSPTTTTTCAYTPHPYILATQPASAPDPNALYAPLTRTRFRTSAAAKAHRKHARLAPKAGASDVARVKALGRDYWVCRIFNAMINSGSITDGRNSVHRTRFTSKLAFSALDLEAAAHAVFDEAIAVHERGWNQPVVYHKHTVRGKLVDISGQSLELRLSRVCLVLEETKSAVDDAVRGGVTLALLCDNPEARRFTKESNNFGNLKRGERLRQTRTKERAKAKAVADQNGGEDEEVEEVEEVEAQELVDFQVVPTATGSDRDGGVAS